MRVTAGKYGGRVLKENTFAHIRPTADMVKQALFNKLGQRVVGARVLDLCCGTGALGIEALSRGASEVVFVDNDKRSLFLTKQNLDMLGITANLIRADAVKAIKSLQGQKFDIVIFDPPYKSDLYILVLTQLLQSDLLSDDAIVTVEHAKRDTYVWPEGYTQSDTRQYGIKQITYLTKN